MLVRTAMAGGGIALVPQFTVDEELAAGRRPSRARLAASAIRESAYYPVYPEHLGELGKVRRFVEHITISVIISPGADESIQ